MPATITRTNFIDAYDREIRDSGARVLKAPRDEPWGMREFSVRTADGHRTMFGQELELDRRKTSDS